ncbi:acyl-CoA carboxylase subunit epsilon [Kineococcus terrestris]|uniref:acyl-CoA carboxylase subunit epsilon n=1 Tax=Kineococcus terrestris TaxID=2044856 RepID=UPI0034DB37BA
MSTTGPAATGGPGRDDRDDRDDDDDEEARVALEAAELLGSLRIERGHPEPEELAALTVVLTSTLSTAAAQPAAGTGVGAEAPRSRWADRRHVLGLPPRPGPGGWRASALPRAGA